jgi:hypothetical protein
MSASILDHYARKRAEQAEEETDYDTADEDRETYRAWATSHVKKRNGETRLRLCLADGTVVLTSYAYLMEVLCTSHQNLSLIYTNVVFTLRGRHLTSLIDLLQEEQLYAIYCFRGDYFAEPPEDTPVITAIERLSVAAAMNDA